MIKQYFIDIYFDLKWIFEEIVILIKHPTRKTSWQDLKYHWYKLWNHTLFHPCYCLKRGVRNLFVWFPLIWRNDVFDQFYLEDLMDKQLKEMEDFWYSDNPHVMKKNQIAKRITWTRQLMKMYRDEYYTMKAYDEHKKLFPREELFGNSTPHTIDEFGITTTYICEPMSESEGDHYRRTMEPARIKDEKVFKLFIKNFSRLREWWD